jgi:hypothetical protein
VEQSAEVVKTDTATLRQILLFAEIRETAASTHSTAEATIARAVRERDEAANDLDLLDEAIERVAAGKPLTEGIKDPDRNRLVLLANRAAHNARIDETAAAFKRLGETIREIANTARTPR